MMKISLTALYEQNVAADERFCCNGGGYFQPLVKFLAGGTEFTYSNTSCGEFGDRVSLTSSKGGFAGIDTVDSCEEAGMVEGFADPQSGAYVPREDMKQIMSFLKDVDSHAAILEEILW